MKTIFSVILLSILFLSENLCNQYKNGWKEYNLKGKVCSIKEESYFVSRVSGEIVKDENKYGLYRYGKYYVFNELGYIIDLSIDKYDGSPIYKDGYKYDNQNKCIEMETYDSDHNVYEKFTYTYDKTGHRIDQKHYDSEIVLDMMNSYKYDLNGNCIEERKYFSDSSLFSKIVYVYDNKGNNIELKVCKPNGKISGRFSYKYDDNGNRIEECWFNSEGSLQNKKNSKYDNKGNCIEIVVENFIGLPNEKYTYLFEYDETGNWIRKLESINNLPKFIIEREIKYCDN